MNFFFQLYFMSVNDVVELEIKSDSEQLGISLPKE